MQNLILSVLFRAFLATGNNHDRNSVTKRLLSEELDKVLFGTSPSNQDQPVSVLNQRGHSAYVTGRAAVVEK